MEFQRETLVPVRNPGLSNISGVASLDLIETRLHSKSPGVSHSETTELRVGLRPWAAKNPGSLSNVSREVRSTSGLAGLGTCASRKSSTSYTLHDEVELRKSAPM